MNYVISLKFATHWIVADGAPLREQPGKGKAIASLTMYTRVSKLGEVTTLYNGKPTLFYEVSKQDTDRSETRGFVYSGYVDTFRTSLGTNIVKVSNQTPNMNDPEQNLELFGATQFNLCGYFAIAYATGWRPTANELMELLRLKKPGYIARLFGAKNRGLTGADDLVQLLSLLGVSLPAQRVAKMLTDPITNTVLFSPGKMAAILEQNRVIYSVRIDKRSGRLSRSGVLHWIVVEQVFQEWYSAGVMVYNPYWNNMEVYDWQQLMESGGSPYGVPVPRSPIAQG